MTARELRDLLCADLRGLFAADRYKTPDGGESAPNVYRQALPVQDSGGSLADPFPYIIVRVSSGGIESQDDPHAISLGLIIGIYDDDLSNQGAEAVLEIIERIQLHLEETPWIGPFALRDPVSWTLQDEASYPYYFGGVQLTFAAPPPRTIRTELS